jgi:hypothetical protein
VGTTECTSICDELTDVHMRSAEEARSTAGVTSSAASDWRENIEHTRDAGESDDNEKLKESEEPEERIHKNQRTRTNQRDSRRTKRWRAWDSLSSSSLGKTDQGPEIDQNSYFTEPNFSYGSFLPQIQRSFLQPVAANLQPSEKPRFRIDPQSLFRVSC